MLEEIRVKEQLFESRINFFGQIIDKIAQIKEQSKHPEEEILQFFFDNQDKIDKSLKEEN